MMGFWARNHLDDWTTFAISEEPADELNTFCKDSCDEKLNVSWEMSQYIYQTWSWPALQVEIQSRYDLHRTTRNSQQRAKLLSADFPGLLLDPILQRLENPALEPGFVDPRHCLVFWARPTQNVRNLTTTIQEKLLAIAPSPYSTRYGRYLVMTNRI